MGRRIAPIACIALTLSLLAACTSNEPQNISGSAFYGPGPGSPYDRSGQLPIDNAPGIPAQLPKPPPPGIPNVVAQVSTQPTTQPLPLAPETTKPAHDQYMVLGAMLLQVYGEPIFANKVLRLNAGPLKSDAQQNDLDAFESKASDLIIKAIGEQVDGALEYAHANRTLDADSKGKARALASLWRDQQISQAGGSLELARRRALADGKDFDQEVEDQYRSLLVQVDISMSILPQATVTAAQERQFYHANIFDYTTKDQAQIHLLSLDPTEFAPTVPPNDQVIQATQEMEQNRDRARKPGTDFTQFELKFYHDYYSDGGSTRDYNVLAPGDLAKNPLVEAEVWKMQPGQVSDPIRGADGFIYLIKMDSRTYAAVRPFEDPTVQAGIDNLLRSGQIKFLIELRMQELRRGIIPTKTEPQTRPGNEPPDPILPAVDMALGIAKQNYPYWRKP